MKLIEFTNKGIYCPQGNFYIDPWFPVDFAVITHAHADHARWGMKKYLCHHDTKPVLKLRIAEDISVQSVGYGETITKNNIKITFFPAGHVIGSAQIKLEYKGFIAVVSGDYKLQDDGLSVPFQPVKCHEFVTESTFGLPIYRWDEVRVMNRKLQDWVSVNQNNGKTPVLVGYSLGKAQRILKALEGTDRILVHNSIARVNSAFEESGIALPPYSVIDFTNKNEMQGATVIVPPALLDSNVIKKIPNAALAICSGWMQVRGSRRWRSADAGFAISDHADWNGLLQAVKETEAEKVYVTHGFTDVFSKYLNEIGIDAEAISTRFGGEEPDEVSPDSDENKK